MPITLTRRVIFDLGAILDLEVNEKRPLLSFAIINQCPVITDQPYTTCRAVNREVHMHGRTINIVRYGQSLVERARYLNERRFRAEPWTYVDANEITRALIAAETKCQVLTPHEAFITLSIRPITRNP